MQLSQSRTRVVYYTSFATDFAYFAFLFSITRWLAESGSSQLHMGIFGACASISYALCGPLAGIVSDRFGRRRVMWCGAAFTIAVLFSCSVWRSRPLFYAMAAACGFSVSLIFPPLIAWLTEDGNDTSRRLFLFCLSWNGGVVASQLTAGWLYRVRPELPMLASVVPMAGIIALLSAWRPPESSRSKPVQLPEVAPEPRARAFVYLGWLANGAGALSFSLVTHLFPYLAHESGISPPVHGAMLAANRLAIVGTYFVMYRFVFWRYRLWTAIVSQLIAMAGLAVLGFAPSVPLLTAGLMLTAPMLGYNYFASIYYSTMAFGTRRKGVASGIHEGSLAIGGALGALGGGSIGAAYGARAPYRLCVVLLGVFIVAQLLIHRMVSRRSGHLAAAVAGLLAIHPAVAADATLPGTTLLTVREPLDEVMVAGIDRYCLRAISAARRAREGITPNRSRFREWIGASGPRLTEARTHRYRFEAVHELGQPPAPARGDGFIAHAVRWPVLDGVNGEGLLWQPEKVRAAAVLIPDADGTPEMLSGLASRLAASGVLVAVPALISRSDEWSGHPRTVFTNQPHREFLYRQSFPLGRHVIGYEVQRVLAAVDLLEQFSPAVPIGVAGMGEGGLLALYAAALDGRIRSTLVSGYFRGREEVWREPLYRNVWGLLTEFGDAELAGLIAPRRLVIDPSGAIEVPGPPPVREGRRASAAPGALTAAPLDSVRAEFERGAAYYRKLGLGDEIRLSADGGDAAVRDFAAALGIPVGTTPEVRTEWAPGAANREKRLFEEVQTHVQALLHRSHQVRDAMWRNVSGGEMRSRVQEEVIGRLPSPRAAPAARSRLVLDRPGYTGHEVMLDVVDDVIASGILLLPRGLRPGERRPVVVCQHGLEATAMDTITRDSGPYASYKAFAEQLVNRGFVVYAPQNPYRGGDRFRAIQRKANPLKLSLFSFIVAQHEQTLRWLSTLDFVDPHRIGFYGLSYGGKTAIRVPPLVPGYALSICSGDFTEWTRSLVTNEEKPGYLVTPEYETPEWNIGHVADHAELAILMAPRPFLVEAGYRDSGQPVEWVMSQFGKVRRHYDQAGIGDRAEIDLFDGPHTIHGEAAFRFLHRHLSWPEPRR